MVAASKSRKNVIKTRKKRKHSKSNKCHQIQNKVNID